MSTVSDSKDGDDETGPEVVHADLGRFLQRCREYESTVPEEVCRYYLREGGVDIREDENQELVLKLVALATDHFLVRVCQDARDFSALRGRNDNCLRIQDIMLALQRRGVTTLHPTTDEELSAVVSASTRRHVRTTSTGAPSRSHTPPPGASSSSGKRPRSANSDGPPSDTDPDTGPHHTHKRHHSAGALP
mmetsp:Transcript_23183/g.30002  ORF Transcript_23183/g.30002 Transcript_23183/m.30002 type:complete len:191 (-) Transcript_23183:282-854(-)